MTGRIGAQPAVVYVSSDGADWQTGTSANSPLRTISHAVRIVAESGEVRILPGIFQERVHVNRGGEADGPLRIVADTPGTVTIDWSSPLSGPRWRNEQDGIFSTPIGGPVYNLSAGLEVLFRVPWGGVEALRGYVSRSDAWGAFAVEERRLYVFLRGSHSPADVELRVNRPVPAPREWGEFKSANLWVEADHVHIRGISFDFGIGASIRVWSGDHIHIEDCAFHGATHGVRARDAKTRCDDLVVQSCLYHNYPQHDWSRGWLTWKEIYSAYSSNGIVSADGRAARILSNLVLHAGDGMQVSVASHATTDTAEISGNRIDRVTDDAIEFDGDASHMVVRDNAISRAHVSMGTSPVTIGPLRIEGNLCWACAGHLKFLSPWQDRQTIRGVTIRGNIFVDGYPAWWSETATFEEIRIESNLFISDGLKADGLPADVSASDNVIVLSDSLAPQSPMELSKAARIPDPVCRRLRVHEKLRMLKRHVGPTWWNLNNHPATQTLQRTANKTDGDQTSLWILSVDG